MSQQGFPTPNSPVVDPETGRVTPIWQRFFLTIFTRTGGASGAAGAVQSVTPTASPFVYTALQAGALLISGGGVSSLSYSRDGVHWYPTGSFYGAFELSSGDLMTITYPGAPPSVSFVPR